MQRLLKAASSFSLVFVLGKANVLNAAYTSAGPVGNNAVRAYPGPGAGDVTLEWQRASIYGENYSIWYGTEFGKYQNSADHIGYVTTYTVHGLQRGVRYYFGIQPIWAGNMPQNVSGVVSAVAPSGGVTVIGSAGPIGRNGLTAKKGLKSGEVFLTWNKYFADTDGYSIVYGEFPGKYIYGAVNAVKVVGSQTQFSFTVGALRSGKRYYFALVPSRASIGGTYVTTEASMVAR